MHFDNIVLDHPTNDENDAPNIENTEVKTILCDVYNVHGCWI